MLPLRLRLLALLPIVPAHAALTITPTFDASITNNPNAAAIEAAVNRAIAVFESLFADPINVSILFRYSSTSVNGGPISASVSDSILYTVPWNTFTNALVADAKTVNDTVAKASLPAFPLSANVRLTSANGRAIGLSTPGVMRPDGSIGGGTLDGIVTLNSTIAFQFDRTGGIASGHYDAQRFLEHEIDEILGTGSFLNLVGTDVRPADLFSWSSPGIRNLTIAGSRYFSINGGQADIVGFNQTSGRDFGDWFSPPCPQPVALVQYAAACSGAAADISAASPEGIALDVIGYDLASAILTPVGFFALPPCRMVDTRSSQGKTSFFGPPALLAGAGRDFPLLSSGCAIPNSAAVYSVNATVVPRGPLDFLSAWPSGQPYPGVSTLNSPDGSIIANAALLPAGSNGSVTVLAGEATDLILDTNGYFAPPNGQELVFYPIAPCRVADTRSGQGKNGPFGPPNLVGFAGRDFPISSGTCGVPASAQAYSLNMTVVPLGDLDFLTVWPSGQTYPGVSTLNSPDGSTIANAAIVPAGHNGAITVLADNATHLIIDVNGYFAPPGLPGALHFYPLAPCRIVDTRAGQGKTGAFGPPALTAFVGRDFPIPSSSCTIPTSAQAYALNMTALPHGRLDFLSAWPSGQPYPNVSTLNSPKGTTIANAAIVPAGTNGAITVLSGNPTDLIIDISGFFAP